MFNTTQILLILIILAVLIFYVGGWSITPKSQSEGYLHGNHGYQNTFYGPARNCVVAKNGRPCWCGDRCGEVENVGGGCVCYRPTAANTTAVNFHNYGAQLHERGTVFER